MNSNRIVAKLEDHFHKHNTRVELALDEIIEEGEWFIFNVRLKKGSKKKQFFDRAVDIQASLGLALLYPFEDGQSIKLSVSVKPLTENSLQKMITSPRFRNSAMHLPIPLGYDVRGAMQFVDLVLVQHGLCGGATGSGKSVFLRNSILCIAAKNPVNKVNFIIIDTGASGLDVFNNLPHLSYPVVKGTNEAACVVNALRTEMERRVTLPKPELKKLPAIVCVMDEYASLIKNIDDYEKGTLIASLSNLLMRGRHAKIHLILATQESFKQDMAINLNNLNARIAFRCSDFYNSKAILGEAGAEKLPGKGAMLYKSPEQVKPVYLQGAFMHPETVQMLVARIASKSYDDSNKFTLSWVSGWLVSNHQGLGENSGGAISPNPKPNNDQLERDNSSKELAGIIHWILGRETVSVRQIKQEFPMGNRADDVMGELFRLGLVSDKYHNQPRTVIQKCFDDLSDGVVSLLKLYGYTDEAIHKKFGSEGGGSDAATEIDSLDDNESFPAIESGEEDDYTCLNRQMTEVKTALDNTSRIVRIVTDMALQTNLLALNVATEAVRDGEHGNQFVAIAEEVRTLTERSQTASKDVIHSLESLIKKFELAYQMTV